jgi:Smg protein
MKESILDVLMYLYENYVETEFSDESNFDLLRVELVGAGFPEEEVDNAFNWLSGLAASREELVNPAAGSIRLYARAELTRLGPACRGFLLYLEQLGLLTPRSRELVIDRLISIEDEIDLERVKWVVLLVLINQPGTEDAIAQVEEMVYYDGDFLH